MLEYLREEQRMLVAKYKAALEAHANAKAVEQQCADDVLLFKGAVGSINDLINKAENGKLAADALCRICEPPSR